MMMIAKILQILKVNQTILMINNNNIIKIATKLNKIITEITIFSQIINNTEIIMIDIHKNNN